MAIQDILRKMATKAEDPMTREAMKKRALEDILGMGASQRKTAMREVQKRGLGTSGAALLAGTRGREATTEAAARATKDIEIAEKEKEFGRMGQVAQLGMQQRSQEFGEEMGREQLALQQEQVGQSQQQIELARQAQVDDIALRKAQFDQDKSNTLWQQMEATRTFDTQMDLKIKQMDQAWGMFQQGQIQEADMQKMANSFVQWQTSNAQQFARDQQSVRNAWQSAQSQRDRNNVLEVAKISGDIQKYVADRNAEAQETSWYDYIFPAIGAAGAAASGYAAVAALPSDKNLKKKINKINDLKDIEDMMENLNPFSFEYLGDTIEHLGVMAQDLEKSRFGKMMVLNTPKGKMININKLIYGLFGVNSLLYNKIKDLEARSNK